MCRPLSRGSVVQRADCVQRRPVQSVGVGDDGADRDIDVDVVQCHAVIILQAQRGALGGGSDFVGGFV